MQLNCISDLTPRHIAASIFLLRATTFGIIEDGRREAEYGTREAAVWIERLEKGDQIYETILRRGQFEKINTFKMIEIL